AADDAAARARAMEPQPIEPDRIALIEKLEGAGTLAGRDIQTVWISDGLDYGAAAQFSERLSNLAGGGVTLIEPPAGMRALALLPPDDEGDRFAAQIIRADGRHAREGGVRAIGGEGS